MGASTPEPASRRGWRSGIHRAGIALALVAVIAACTGCSDDGGEKPSTTTAPIPGEIVDGGVVRLGIAGAVAADPRSANPASPSDLMVLDLLHDGLVRVGPDGALVPQVAASWRHNIDLTAWLFQVDPAATFSDGRAIKNTDVVASLERLMAGGLSSLPALRLEAVKGFAAFITGKAPHVAGITTRDGGGVHIELDRAISTIPQILAAPEMGIVDVTGLDALADGGSLAEVALSGSWAVTAADDDAVALERREGRAGHLAGVELHAFDDAETAYGAFQDGSVDWALVPGDERDDAVDEYGDAHDAPFQAEVFFGLRVAKTPLNKSELRNAIAWAIDREAIAEEVYADIADPLASVVPAGVPGHDPEVCSSCGYDPDAAREALEKGYPDGKVPTVHIDFDESDTQAAMAEMVADDLEDVGIPTELRVKPAEDYRRFVVTGDQELFSFGWIGGYASPGAYLSPLFASAADDNLTGIADGKVDAGLLAARGADDAGTHWREVEARVLQLSLVVPIAQFRTQPVVSGRVQGLAHAVDGSVDWASVWVTDGAG